MDETGTTALMRGTLAAGTDAEAALAYLNGLASAVSAISGCFVTRISVSYRNATVPLPAPDTADSCRDQGLFVFQTDNPGDLAVVSVSGISRTLLRTDGCFSGVQVDLENSSVISFIEAITGDIWTDPFVRGLTAVQTAYIREVM